MNQVRLLAFWSHHISAPRIYIDWTCSMTYLSSLLLKIRMRFQTHLD